MADNLKNTSTSNVYLNEFNENNVNLLKICRLCLVEINELVSLFDRIIIDGQEILYSEMAIKCASVEVDENDKLPKLICFDCVENLNNSYKFRKLCKNSERILNNRLKKIDDNFKSDITIKSECDKDIEVEEYLIPKSEPISPQSNNSDDLNTINNSDQSLKDIKLEPNSHIIYIQSNINEQLVESTSASNSSMSSNLKVVEGVKSGKQSYKCKVCGKSFSTSSSLKRHNLLHSGEKPYKCKECGKSFTYLSNFKVHQNVHLVGEEKPFKCGECEKSFGRLCDLKLHQKGHSGEKPHVCKVCGKSFLRATNLKTHQIVHLDKKVYSCKDCGKSFGSNHYLRKHQERHRGEKPYNCDRCEKHFTCYSDFYEHNRKCSHLKN